MALLSQTTAHLSDITVGISTLNLTDQVKDGCWSFVGPIPPLLWMSATGIRFLAVMNITYLINKVKNYSIVF